MICLQTLNSVVPNSPSRDTLSSQSPQVISETEIKQLRAKVVNLEYDITEKNEKISALEADLRNCKSMTSHGTFVTYFTFIQCDRGCFSIE